MNVTGMTLISRYHIQDVLAIWVLLPLIWLMPVVVWGYAMAALVLVPWLPAAWQQRSVWLLWGFLISSVALLVVLVLSWLAGENLVALTALLVVAKRFETRQARDLHAFLALVFVCSALSLIYWNSLWALLHLVVLMALILVSTRMQSGTVRQDADDNNRRMAGLPTISLIMLWSLPLTITLFMLLPRIPGPLWDVGLVLGMPLSAFEKIQKISLKATSNPLEKALEKQQQANQLVLVAEFKGSAPLRSNLYWRGPVYYRYQGGQWQDSLEGSSRSMRLRSAHRDKAWYQQQLHQPERLVQYQAKVSGNQTNYLYALDIPAGNVQESFITGDGQLLSIRPLFDEFSYETSAYLNGQHGAGADPKQSQPTPVLVPDAALSSEQQNGILRLLDHWQQSDGGAVAIKTVLATLANPPEWLPYPFRAEPAALKDHIGFYMLALNRAGVPARMVEGFRGGDLVAMTDFIVVRQKHRHIWLEVWNDQQGWQRFDIRDLVMGARVEAARTVAKTRSAEQTRTVTAPPASDNTTQPAEPARTTPDSSLFEALENWFLGYAPETATTPEKSDQANASSDLTWLVWVLVAGLVLVALAFSYVLLGLRQRQPPLKCAWNTLEQALQPFGIQISASACPSLLLPQLPEAAPSWQAVAAELVQEYLQLRYGPTATSQQIDQFHRKVVRFKGIIQDVPKP